MSWRARISKSIQEIRMVSCSTSESSKGMREFLKQNYNELKVLNPATPFLYRQAHGLDEAFIYARYDWGQERKEIVTGKSAEEITNILEELTAYGFQLPRSPESDVILPNPIIDGNTDEYDYPGLNLSWDGVSVRQNPYLNLEEVSVNN